MGISALGSRSIGRSNVLWIDRSRPNGVLEITLP